MSDIRKIQTGSNQYTLHARVSDKLAVSSQIGSPTKPVYVDSSGQVKACSREIPNIPYSVTKINPWYIGDFCYDAINSYNGPDDYCMLRVFFLEPGDKIIVHTTESYKLALYFVNDDESFMLEVRVNTPIIVNDYLECVLRSTYHNGLPEGYVEIYRNNSTATDTLCLISKDLSYFLGVEQADCLYVNKTDGPFCRYKGSVDSLSNLTSPNYLTKENAGEVYKIRTASTNNSITTNPGDYVVFVWDETKNTGHWDNLSGTVANAGYAEKIGTDKSHPQIGSPTKPVYVDSSGQVKACSREIPTGMTIDSVLNDTSVNAVQNKVINAALKGKNPKAKADFIASSDLSGLPITTGVLDLNGYTLTLSGTTQLTGTLTIKNGTIGGEGTLQTDQLIFVNDCDLIVSSKINLSSTISILDNIHVKDVMSNFFILNVGEDYYATISPSAYCLITNFSGITIEGTNTNYNIIAQNGNNLLARNAKIKVLNVSAVELQGKFDADIYNCQNIRFDSSQVDKSSTYTISFSTVETGTGQSFVRYGFKDQNGVIGDSLKPNDIIDASDHSVITSKAVVDYLRNYVKKDDISTVYKYKGTKTNFSELTTSGNNIGDVWNITNADTANHIKAGDNVVWNGSKWDNLSGTVDLSNYLQKGGKQTTTSTADGGSNVYTFKDGSTITVKNGSKGSTGAAATWFSGDAVTGTSTTAKTFTVSGSKAGDMYLNTGTSNVYKATAANQWVYLCNIKGPQGTPGNNGTTPTIKAAAGGNIGVVGTPSVTANTSGTTTTFTFNNLKGQKGDTGATVTWHTGTAVTGTAATVAGAKTGDMYLNTKTYNVYKSTGTNKWAGVCNIKGANGTTPTIKAAAGSNINSVGTPTVSATTSGATTTFTFNNLKGQKGEAGATITWHTGTAVPNAGVHAVTNAKVGDMYLNTHTCDVFKAANAVQASFNWVLVCNIKGAKGDAADIPKLAKGVAGIVPGTTDDSLNASRWLNGGDNGTGKWLPLPIAGGGTTGIVRTCKDYTGSINKDDIHGYAHGTTPPTLQPITSGASDYRGVESDGSGRLFVNVPAYEKNINRAQNTVLAAPTTGTGTATFRKLTTSDIPWGDKLKVVTESQFNSTTPRAGVFYFVLEE